MAAAPAPPPPPQPPSEDDARDLALIRQIREGGPAERQAWTELVRRYQDRLFAVCMRMVGNREVAGDLTQDAFVKVIQGLETYDGRSKFSTWLFRVAMNVCLSHLRAQKLRKHASLDHGVLASLVRGGGDSGNDRGSITVSSAFAGSAAADGPDREQTGPLGVEKAALRRTVSAALASLASEHRAILILRDVQGLEYDQIAVALEIAQGTVKSRLFRARAALREAFEKLQAPEPGSPPRASAPNA